MAVFSWTVTARQEQMPRICFDMGLASLGKTRAELKQRFVLLFFQQSLENRMHRPVVDRLGIASVVELKVCAEGRLDQLPGILNEIACSAESFEDFVLQFPLERIAFADLIQNDFNKSLLRQLS